MRLLLVILMIIGCFAGPGYFIYSKFYSGSSYKTITMMTQKVQHAKVGHLQVHKTTNKQWNSPVSLDLAPSMNPITVTASVQYLKPQDKVRRANRYNIKLMKGEKPVWEDDFSVSYHKKKKKDGPENLAAATQKFATTNISVRTFSVKESGSYTLEISQNQDSSIRELVVDSLDIEIRQNVLVTNVNIVIAGFLALLVGVLGFFMTGKKEEQAA